jgi:hypothetical protein
VGRVGGAGDPAYIGEQRSSAVAERPQWQIAERSAGRDLARWFLAAEGHSVWASASRRWRETLGRRRIALGRLG